MEKIYGDKTCLWRFLGHHKINYIIDFDSHNKNFKNKFQSIINKAEKISGKYDVFHISSSLIKQMISQLALTKA